MPTKVTDPTLIAQLNGGSQKVTDPAILAQLNGTPATAAVGGATNAPSTAQMGYDQAIAKVQKDYGLNDEQVGRLKQQYDPSVWKLAQAGTTFGLSDELSGLAGGLTGMLQGKDFGTSYGDFSGLQSAALDLTREKNGMLGSAVEMGTSLATIGPEKAAVDAIISGIPKAAPSLAKTIIGSSATGAGLGGLGGFTSTNGDIGQRLEGAGHGAALGASLGAVAPAIAHPLGEMLAGRATQTAAPSLADLKSQYDPLYKAAKDSGVTVNQAGTSALAGKIRQIAQDEGLISATGKIADGYGRLPSIIRTFDDHAAGGSMTVPQIQSVTKTLQDAAGSIDKGERRVAIPMLKAFKDFVAEGIPEIKQADPIYASAMNGQKVERAIEKAKYPGSSLQGTFKTLSNKIEDGRLHGFNADEAAAIKKVAMGTALSNNLTGVGDFLTRGAPAIVGFPVGFAAKGIANGIQGKNAAIASALVRSRVVPGAIAPSQQRLAQALINTGALGPLAGSQVAQ